MRAAVKAKSDPSQWRETVSATCVADDATGVRKLRMRDWQIIGDSGRDFGGWGLGPNSPELFCGVISTCLTHTYLIAAATLEIPLDRVEVTVSSSNNDAHFLGLISHDPSVPFDIEARISLEAAEASTEEITKLHTYAAENCPLSRLVREPNVVTLITD
tara:strand:- start:2635 stop:3111 length:477 start_codon:yes stop_codon:yes gene_type:complete